jgi:hypothetical protein
MGGWRCGQEVQVMAVPQDPKGSDPELPAEDAVRTERLNDGASTLNAPH